MELAVLLALLPLLLALGLRWKYHSNFKLLFISTSTLSLLIVVAFTIYHYGAMVTEMSESEIKHPVVFSNVVKNSLVFLLGALFYNALLAWMFYTREKRTIE